MTRPFTTPPKQTPSLGRAEDVHACIEDEQVGHTAEDLLGLVRRPGIAVTVGDVQLDGMNRGALLLEISHCLIQVVLTVVGDDDLHARFGEDLGIAEARAGSAAGDKCDLASKVFHDIAPYLKIFPDDACIIAQFRRQLNR